MRKGKLEMGNGENKMNRKRGKRERGEGRNNERVTKCVEIKKDRNTGMEESNEGELKGEGKSRKRREGEENKVGMEENEEGSEKGEKKRR